MMKPYRLVIFDWEGTLADTLGCILDCVTSEAQRLGFGAIDTTEVRSVVDFGLVKGLKLLLPKLSAENLKRLVKAVEEALAERSNGIYLFPGAKEFVLKLQQSGVILAIATNKSSVSLQRVLTVTGLAPYFQLTRSADQTASKPNPQMLLEILEETGLQASEALMIGDTMNDMLMAKKVGMSAVAVDFYHQQPEALQSSGALAVFDDFYQLAEYYGA